MTVTDVHGFIHCYDLELQGVENVNRLLFKGSSHFHDAYDLMEHIPNGFVPVEAFRSGNARMVWKSDSEKAYITYCEGDLDVITCADDETYQNEFNRMNEFYAVMT